MNAVMQRLLFVLTSVLLVCSAHAASQEAQFPSRPIRLTVAVPPGGAADFTARIVAQKFTDALGQNRRRKPRHELHNVLAMPDVKERFAQQGALATPMTPQQYTAFVKAEMAKWGPVVKASGAKVD